MLGLSHNRLSELPPGLSRLSRLECLRLCGNVLAGLPAEVTTLSVLTRLDISGEGCWVATGEAMRHGTLATWGHCELKICSPG